MPTAAGIVGCLSYDADKVDDLIVEEESGPLSPKQLMVTRILGRLDDRHIEVQGSSWFSHWFGESMNDYSPFGQISAADKAVVVRESARQEVLNKAMGCMCGMAVGDSLGHMFEFLPAIDAPDPMGSYYDLKEDSFQYPKNKFALKRGQWTDDCSMALCIADSLLLRRAFDGSDQRTRFWLWWFMGYNNAFRKDDSRTASVGLGGNISKSLMSLKPHVPPTPRFESKTEDAGNGSIMRLGPVPIFFRCACREDLFEAARSSSHTTHPGAVAAEACCLLSHLVVQALEVPLDPAPDARAFLDAALQAYLSELGAQKGPGLEEMRQLAGSAPVRETEACWDWRARPLAVKRTLRARGECYNGYPVSDEYFGSYAPDALAMALHCVYHNSSFEATIAHVINLLGDADSTAAVCGQIAGALYGYSRIPRSWLADLEQWDELEIPLRGALLATLGPDPGAFPMAVPAARRGGSGSPGPCWVSCCAPGVEK